MNGEAVENLADLVHLVESCQTEFLTFDLEYNQVAITSNSAASCDTALGATILTPALSVMSLSNLPITRLAWPDYACSIVRTDHQLMCLQAHMLSMANLKSLLP